MSFEFEYFYGKETEQFSFYRIPKMLFKESMFKDVSAEAKVLYGLMLDRTGLPVKNGWLDEENRVYIVYTVAEIMDDLNCGNQKAAKLLSELDTVNGIGLIEKKRQGLGKPNIIYVKNFYSASQFKNNENHICNFAILRYQQEDGFNTVLPYGLMKIKAVRTLTTESTAVLMPYKTQEIIDPGGLYYGINAISHNLLMCNRKLLLNGNGFVLGVSGSGKSFASKLEIALVKIFTKDDIIVIDPEREYAPLIKNLGGENIKLSVSSSKDARKEYVSKKLKTKAEYQKRQAEESGSEALKNDIHSKASELNAPKEKSADAKTDTAVKTDTAEKSSGKSMVKTKESYMQSLRESNPDGKLSRNYTAKTAIISDGTHEAIIDMETWEKVQEKMKEQKTKYRKYYDPDRKELSHWLVGIVRCEKYGAVLSNQGGFYGCSNRSRGTCKGVGYIKTTKLDGIVLNTLSNVTLPNVKLAFAEPETIEQTETEDESLIISTQIQRLEIRLDRVRLAYEDGVDTLQEYKANKKSLLDEIANLKALMKKKRLKNSQKQLQK